MAEGNQDLDAVTRDICIEGAVWSLGARNNPLYLKRSDLNPVARGWHEFIIHNIMPTTNQHYHHEQPADGYGWGQLQEDMANMSKNQTEFYDSMLVQQAAYGLRLQEMEKGKKKCGNSNKRHGKHNINSNKR
ncbi:hypothetical protein PIB30_085307 [Stylosanthes scabra]|uniref:Uncharacterized protein n=1 Tax=Stylosanthes scabra TaxID=79078 RepID=A0ABU6YQE6_9FABA|nr:hypothetical protein [Stylosanthes scabra]